MDVIFRHAMMRIGGYIMRGGDSNPRTPTRSDLKSGTFGRAGNRYFAAISKSGFTKKAEEFAKENDFLLFTLDDF